jgi:hypothetical protein
MSPDSRSLIAAIAWTVVHRSRCAWVYDHDLALHREVSASISGDKVGAYDHARRCIIEGTLGQTLVDHALGGHITLERTDAGIKGYDHPSEAFYEVIVKADDVSVYDYADARHHAFAVRAA